MDEFSVTRNRDASPTIMGFCYQVDCTLERWLRLESNQWLELERGEDIDIVAKAILGGGQTDQRQLEQIKRLSSRLSLRSKEVLGFLANAVEHRETNPGRALVFRFVTNSEITTERPSAFDDRESGIRIWGLLRLKKLPESERTPRLAGLRALLQRAKNPKDIPAATWTKFQAFLCDSDDSALGEFIDSVEWSMSNLDADGMKYRVREMLQEHGFCKSIEHAEEVHGGLFVHTLRLLAQPGRKTLTRADLVRQATVSPLTDAEKRMLRELSDHVTSLNARLDDLQDMVHKGQATLLAAR